jgi:hypothetical protein
LWATDAGFLVSANGITVASDVPIVHAIHGVCLLTDDGFVVPKKVA